MIYTITYILNNRMDCIKCKGKDQLIKQYYELIKQNAKIVKIQDVFGDEVNITVASEIYYKRKKKIPEKVEQFIKAAEALGIEVRCDPDWDEEGTICITFINVFDTESNDVYIMLSPDGHLIES